MASRQWNIGLSQYFNRSLYFYKFDFEKVIIGTTGDRLRTYDLGSTGMIRDNAAISVKCDIVPVLFSTFQ